MKSYWRMPINTYSIYTCRSTTWFPSFTNGYIDFIVRCHRMAVIAGRHEYFAKWISCDAFGILHYDGSALKVCNFPLGFPSENKKIKIKQKCIQLIITRKLLASWSSRGCRRADGTCIAYRTLSFSAKMWWRWPETLCRCEMWRRTPRRWTRRHMHNWHKKHYYYYLSLNFIKFNLYKYFMSRFSHIYASTQTRGESAVHRKVLRHVCVNCIWRGTFVMTHKLHW